MDDLVRRGIPYLALTIAVAACDANSALEGIVRQQSREKPGERT
ncbi:MAG: hypothetical protein OXH56_05260 [Gemmatimonadetes bacterium]|nr:hypothetical protein [Gemmatimonadota bacterium]